MKWTTINKNAHRQTTQHRSPLRHILKFTSQTGKITLIFLSSATQDKALQPGTIRMVDAGNL